MNGKVIAAEISVKVVVQSEPNFAEHERAHDVSISIIGVKKVGYVREESPLPPAAYGTVIRGEASPVF